MNLNYQMDHTLCQIFYVKIILTILKKYGKNTDNPSVKVYVNKLENRITFEIKTRYYLDLLTPETIKLLGKTENKITKKMVNMCCI